MGIQSLDVEVSIVDMLASLAESAERSQAVVEAKRRAVQQGFMEHFLLRITNFKYSVKSNMKANLDLNSDTDNSEPTDLPLDYSQQELLLDESETDSNLLIEHTIRLAANCTELREA